MRDEWDARAVQDAERYVDSESRDARQFEDRALRDARMILADVERYLTAESAVLEIGCGIGRLLEQMAPRFREVWGIDVSAEMVRQARQRLARLPNATVLPGNGTDLSGVPSDYFDLCYSYIVFQHVPDRAAIQSYLEDARRVLRPRGVLKIQVSGLFAASPFREVYERQAVDTWNGVRFTMSRIVRAVEDAGFYVLSAYHADDRQQYLWVVGRKDGGEEWEAVCLAAGRVLASVAPPGTRVLLPEHGIAEFLVAAGALGLEFVFPGMPEDGDAAVRMIVDLERRGGGYLVLTRYAFWWLDHYPEFRAWVARHGATRSDDCCLVLAIPADPDVRASAGR
jgi:ubiquinone/menaquinone biosynthesis C-methylase UbiE